MLKEYFTDGLIGIAILLSLFRMDLVGINNIINYPEVQEIILGQTAAYLPANFHHVHSSLQAFGNPKHLDFDNTAFNAWFQNVNNAQFLQRRRSYNIEAFLVSESHHNVQQYQTDQIIASISEENNIPPILLHEESANSCPEDELRTSSPSERSDITTDDDYSKPDEVFSDVNETVNENAYFLPNVTSPSNNLTKEDLTLIDVLYQQDVDLGVGKEIFDTSFREELEREQELEILKQHEKQKAQLIAKEKEEQEKREQKDRWLKKNFKRDGETGEWVHLWGEIGEGSNRSLSVPFRESSGNNDSLEVAVDFLGNTHEDEANIDTSDCTNEPVQQDPLFMHQDSFDENWNGLVDYLNMTTNTFDDSLSVSNSAVPELGNGITAPMGMMSDLVQEQDVNFQTEYLIQNATLPTSFTEMANDFSTLTPPEELNSSMPYHSGSMNPTIDFDLGDLNFFSNLTTLRSLSVEDVDHVESEEFLNIINELDSEVVMNNVVAENVDAIQQLEDNLSISTSSHGSSSPFSRRFNDTFDVLEGATGGSDYSINYSDVNDRFSKISHLSESSNDSGFDYQGGFSSPSSSASSKYSGSPAGSHRVVNSSASSNDTEYDPHGSCSVVHHHIAHNHTYNTLPGQVPREVKKYIPKVPSRKGPQSRDQRRAEELKIPFAIEDIIGSSVEAFNEMLSAHTLNDAQLTLVRDIRRRGKNKVAAQNCRKRKVSVIFSLADEMTELQDMRDRLMAEQAAMDREKCKLKEKFGHLYTHIFQSLRDERGEPYDPNCYSLQQSSDGNVFLVPRSLPVNSRNTSSASSSTSSTSSKDSAISKKRKPLDH